MDEHEQQQRSESACNHDAILQRVDQMETRTHETLEAMNSRISTIAERLTDLSAEVESELKPDEESPVETIVVEPAPPPPPTPQPSPEQSAPVAPENSAQPLPKRKSLLERWL